jgi:hypothetical protein
VNTGNQLFTRMLKVFPFRPCIPTKAYAKLNRTIMRLLFAVPLVFIALFESTLDPRMNSFTKAWFEANEEETDEEDHPEYQDPEVSDEETQGKITKIKFHALIKDFPNTSQVRGRILAAE